MPYAQVSSSSHHSNSLKSLPFLFFFFIINLIKPNSKSKPILETRAMVKSSSDRVDSSSPSSSVAPFLRKCYEMVDDSSTDSIISWSTNGDNSFVISDTTVFSAQLLPKYFKHSNLSSFIRQLNIYVSFLKALCSYLYMFLWESVKLISFLINLITLCQL